MVKDDFLWLLQWYDSHCDGDWEHRSSIHIDTIDNPGWSISINLEDTELEKKVFNDIERNYSGNDWLFCCVKNNKFEGRCAPISLLEVLQIFREWAQVDARKVR